MNDQDIYLTALIIMGGLLLLRLRLLRFRLIRAGFGMLVNWFVLGTVYQWTILPVDDRIDLIIDYNPDVAKWFYYGSHTIFHGLVFQVLWLIDVNVFGVLFVNLRKARREVNQEEAAALATIQALTAF